jgi:palmitoyltransferase
MIATVQFWSFHIHEFKEARKHDFVAKALSVNGWVAWGACNAFLHSIWVGCLMVCQLYQVLWLAMTTNERMNCRRYTHFKRDYNGHITSPFDRGFFRNFFDFFELKFCKMFKPDSRDWRFVYEVPDNDHAKTDDTSGTFLV